jgi:triphosphoribosyl-dephospho-CoA synthase
VGNVHRAADFADMNFVDFVATAVVAGPRLAEAPQVGVGRAVLNAVVASRRVSRVNTNLGTVLLLAPLAAVPVTGRLADGIGDVLESLGPQDSQDVYQAIQLARPGGLGEVAAMDVRTQPAPDDLRWAMQAAADRDLVARQYATNFHDVLQVAAPMLRESLEATQRLSLAIVWVHVKPMSLYPDSLIARKCGVEVARQAADYAAWVLEGGSPEAEEFHDRLTEFDFWLRSDGHRRNPGTTADLVAASLFCGLREQWISVPLNWTETLSNC